MGHEVTIEVETISISINGHFRRKISFLEAAFSLLLQVEMG